MKLLPAVVLPRASVLVALPVPDVFSTVVGAAFAFWPVGEESDCDSAVMSSEGGGGGGGVQNLNLMQLKISYKT